LWQEIKEGKEINEFFSVPILRFFRKAYTLKCPSMDQIKLGSAV
jgi:hypothetical protein